MKSLILSLLLLTLLACKGENEGDLSNQEVLADSIESGINSISGVTDDAAGSDMYASIKTKKSALEKVLQELNPIPHAFAANCSRNLSGSNGVCSRDVDCSVGAFQWSGSVELVFSNGSSCSLNSAGESFTREVDFTRSGRRGEVKTTGESKVTKNADNTYSINIISKNKKILRRRDGKTIMDVNVSTTEDLVVNQLARSGRQIQSGALEITHNLAGVIVNKSFNNLDWSDSSCCYPTGGSIAGTFTGNREGSFSVNFTGTCGELEAELNGEGFDFSLDNCE